MFSQPL